MEKPPQRPLSAEILDSQRQRMKETVKEKIDTMSEAASDDRKKTSDRVWWSQR